MEDSPQNSDNLSNYHWSEKDTRLLKAAEAKYGADIPTISTFLSKPYKQVLHFITKKDRVQSYNIIPPPPQRNLVQLSDDSDYKPPSGSPVEIKRAEKRKRGKQSKKMPPDTLLKAKLGKEVRGNESSSSSDFVTTADKLHGKKRKTSVSGSKKQEASQKSRKNLRRNDDRKQEEINRPAAQVHTRNTKKNESYNERDISTPGKYENFNPDEIIRVAPVIQDRLPQALLHDKAPFPRNYFGGIITSAIHKYHDLIGKALYNYGAQIVVLKNTQIENA